MRLRFQQCGDPSSAYMCWVAQSYRHGTRRGGLRISDQ